MRLYGYGHRSGSSRRCGCRGVVVVVVVLVRRFDGLLARLSAAGLHASAGVVELVRRGDERQHVGGAVGFGAYKAHGRRHLAQPALRQYAAARSKRDKSDATKQSE
jgi:hypothetical protein